ncbi:hypothetical protein Val02_00380 [Virgisporangium aliadipatigenens]|uniref:Thiopeptide-type bacteriocin biosynthesis domain-containing protein n=2 Tax=Virgisporangium aliadipatigenens TaxID=741659 RepID=A0A8J4DN36_9ACTN|nr:hypothetical protein Val02_00380 [Virgisporangium aliadipatigenens]
MRLRSPRCERKRAYVTVRDLASELLAASAVHNFCFLHEPPGLRIRFEVADEQRAGTQATIDRRLDGWDACAGVYTPDDAASQHCDRLSTLDALAWLDFHLLAERGRGWLFALAVQRELFPSLGVADGQERRVWTRLRERPRTGPGRLRPGPSAATVRRLWSAPEDLRAGLPRPAATLVDAWAPQLAAAGRAWHRSDLGRRAAAVGPCEGAVHVALLSWNRGRVHPVTQARVASALAEPEDRT